MVDAVLGLVGVVIGLGGGAWIQRWQLRVERQNRNRDTQMAVYADAMLVVQNLIGTLDWLVTEPPFRSRGSARSDLPNLTDVTARIELLASREVRQAWEGVLKAEATLQWNWTEIFDQAEDGPYASPNDPDVHDGRRACTAFKVAARAGAGVSQEDSWGPRFGRLTLRNHRIQQVEGGAPPAGPAARQTNGS